MTPTEKRYKACIALLLLVFAALETPFTLAWIKQQGGMAGTHFDFWNNIFHNPLYQVTAIDFGFTAGLVFLWMIWDSRRREHPWRCWLWLPFFLYCPTIGLLGYILTRRGWEFPLQKSE